MGSKKQKSLLWKIQHKKSSCTSYLFGTMHVRDKSAFFENPNLFAYIDQSDSFYAEFNFDEADSALTTQYMLLPDGGKVTDQLTVKQSAALDQLLQSATGNPLEQFERFKPMMLINLVSESLFSKDYNVPLDFYLFNHAQAQGKKMGGVESFEEQLQIMKNIPLKGQYQSLVSLIKKQKAFKRQIRKMGEYYVSMDIDKLYKSAKKSAKGMRKILIYNRNRIMADRIGLTALEENAFFAIGAGHLAGGKGVLRHLKKHGFKVKPVKIIT